MAEKKQQRQSALLAFLDYDLSKLDSAETSSDESFKIENHEEDSDFGSSDGSDSESDSDESEEKSSDNEPEFSESKTNDKDKHDQPECSTASKENTTVKLLEHSKLSSSATAKLLSTLVCCVCLGDRSDDTNEIVECDGCKITVHEGCYGVSESVSVSSTVSSCSTEPWFCEACKVNVKPDCELCPNRGGIFKETDTGKWVHLVCALYVPGVAFGEVDQLSMVTLFEMQYNKWGAKLCSLCDDERFAQTGVCIGCDAGMCKTYFHVTCAQKSGFLSEAHHEEVDQADPFYAHCKVHSDKTLMKHRKRNYNALQMQIKRYETELEINKNEKPTPEQERIERKLKKHRVKYTSNKLNRAEPWVPTQKMPRLLNTSASACKKLMKKAELMGIDAAALEFQEAQIASLTDIRKKWHIPPAFSTEFVGYYLDRTMRINQMKANLSTQVEVNKSLLTQQQFLRTKYDDAIKVNQDVQQRQQDLIQEIEQLHGAILQLCPSKQLQSIESIGNPAPVAVKVVSSPVPTLSSTPPPQMITNRTMTVPTAAALKMGVGFPLQHLRKDDTGRILSTQCASNANSDECGPSLLNECGICKKCTEQHLLAKCDTCHLYYHLGCLNPPLARHPKRSKLYAWQCSECDKSDDSAPENVIIPKGPRRSRIRYSKDGPIIPNPLHDSFGSELSIAMSLKSDEQPNRSLNGSDVEPKVETTLDSVLTSFKVDVEPITSTPINNQLGETIAPKKRGRKPKAKPSLSISTPIEQTLQETLVSPPSKETASENNHVAVKKQKTHDSKSKESTLIKTSEIISPKVPKKGRPRKEKPSITEISNNLQKKHETSNQQGVKTEESLLDLSQKLELPLEQYRTIADIPNSIPYPAPNVEMPKIPVTVPAVFPQTNSEPESNGVHPMVALNGIALNGDATSSSGHKHKKQKKNKRRHSNSPSSGDRAPSGKKHKKRKKKSHDLEDIPTQTLEQIRSPEQPRIKMKFCAKMVQAGDDKKIMWSLPSTADGEPHRNNANESNPAFTSFGHAFDSSAENRFSLHGSPSLKEPMVSPTNGHASTSPKKRKKPLLHTKKERLLLNISPNKGISSPVIAPSHFGPMISPVTAASVPPTINCDVCQTAGSVQNLVKCDECQKNYHFTCLIPPLRKTPKKRGYSWHCADCDPTDHE